MRLALWSTTALAITLVLQPATPLQGQSPSAEEGAVLAVADSALAAVSRSDFVAFTDLMLDSAVTFSAGMRGTEFRVGFRTRAQQRAVPSSGHYTERGFHPEVRISGPLAMVWLPYDFYDEGKWSHCGVDLFTMLKSDGRWRIATLVWSVEQPPACMKHPNGPPPGVAPS